MCVYHFRVQWRHFDFPVSILCVCVSRAEGHTMCCKGSQSVEYTDEYDGDTILVYWYQHKPGKPPNSWSVKNPLTCLTSSVAVGLGLTSPSALTLWRPRMLWTVTVSTVKSLLPPCSSDEQKPPPVAAQFSLFSKLLHFLQWSLHLFRKTALTMKEKLAYLTYACWSHQVIYILLFSLINPHLSGSISQCLF